jgi:hypothetical protein
MTVFKRISLPSRKTISRCRSAEVRKYMCEAFLIHVGSALEAIERKGYFKAYIESNGDPYTDLQGCSKKGPRGILCKSSNDCVMFFLLTVFSNNAAEAREVLYHKCAHKAPTSQHLSVCTVCGSA